MKNSEHLEKIQEEEEYNGKLGMNMVKKHFELKRRMTYGVDEMRQAMEAQKLLEAAEGTEGRPLHAWTSQERLEKLNALVRALEKAIAEREKLRIGITQILAEIDLLTEIQ
jgi:hypothetical protein